MRRFRRKHAERANNLGCNSTLVVLFRLNPGHPSRSDRTRSPSSDSESEPSSALKAPRDRSTTLNTDHVLTCKPFQRRTPGNELRGLISDDEGHPALRQVDAAGVDPGHRARTKTHRHADLAGQDLCCRSKLMRFHVFKRLSRQHLVRRPHPALLDQEQTPLSKRGFKLPRQMAGAIR